MEFELIKKKLYSRNLKFLFHLNFSLLFESPEKFSRTWEIFTEEERRAYVRWNGKKRRSMFLLETIVSFDIPWMVHLNNNYFPQRGRYLIHGSVHASRRLSSGKPQAVGRSRIRSANFSLPSTIRISSKVSTETHRIVQ